MLEMVVTTAAIRRAKLQSNHYQPANIHLFTGRMPFLLPNQQCQSTEGKSYTILNCAVISINQNTA